MKVHLIKKYITVCGGNKLTPGLVCENCDNLVEQLGGIKKKRNKHVCGNCKKEVCPTCLKKWLD